MNPICIPNVKVITLKKTTTMKKLLAISLSLLGILFFPACEGPAGINGLDGIDGLNVTGTTYEVEIDFTEANNYSDIFDFPNTISLSSVVLIYRLSGIDQGRDIWRLLPQSYFFQEGVLIYNYDFSVRDFSIYTDGPLDYSILSPEWVENQIFRVVVIPSNFAGNRIDYSNYDAVTTMLEIKASDFISLYPRNK
jgi:hypothetical protein